MKQPSEPSAQQKLCYLDTTTVVGVKQTRAPMNRSRSGYGSKLPSSIMLQLKFVADTMPRWHRVYVMQWSNCGSAYIVTKGNRQLLGSYEPQAGKLPSSNG